MLTDSHFHFDGELSLNESSEYFGNFMKKHSIDKAAVLAYCAWLEENDMPHSNVKCLWLKKTMAPKIFAYMSLSHNFEKRLSAQDYLRQLEQGLEMGFDGIKFLEGKPDLRKRLGFSLADSVFDLVYEKLEKLNFPITMHVADPEYFWREPDAYCYYGDGSFLTKEQLYAEVDEILCRFPALNLTLAHFYFLSEDLDCAAKFLDKHPSVNFDITPGWEMFSDFSKNPLHAREFFKVYKNRILWGSDVTNTKINDSYNNEVYLLLTKALGDGDDFVVREKVFSAIGPDEETLHFIKYKNMQRILGDSPRPINCAATRKYISQFMLENPDLSPEYKKELDMIAKDFEQ